MVHLQKWNTWKGLEEVLIMSLNVELVVGFLVVGGVLLIAGWIFTRIE